MSDLEKKSKEKETVDKQKKKKPGLFSKLKTGIPKWLREMRSELKKVVWPTFAQVRNNTGIVIVAVLMVGVVIAAFDWCAGQGVKLLLNTFAGG